MRRQRSPYLSWTLKRYWLRGMSFCLEPGIWPFSDPVKTPKELRPSGYAQQTILPFLSWHCRHWVKVPKHPSSWYPRLTAAFMWHQTFKPRVTEGPGDRGSEPKWNGKGEHLPLSEAWLILSSAMPRWLSSHLFLRLRSPFKSICETWDAAPPLEKVHSWKKDERKLRWYPDGSRQPEYI